MNEEKFGESLANLDKRLTIMETLIKGQGQDGGLIQMVKEIQDKQEKSIRFQNMLIGGLIILQIVWPFLIKMISI